MLAHLKTISPVNSPKVLKVCRNAPKRCVRLQISKWQVIFIKQGTKSTQKHASKIYYRQCCDQCLCIALWLWLELYSFYLFSRYDEIINDNKNNDNTKTNNNIKKNNNVVENHVDPLSRTCFSPDSYFRHILATSGDRYYSKNNSFGSNG